MARTAGSMSVSIAPEDVNCRISSVERCSFAWRIASRTSDTFGASRYPSTCTTSMPRRPTGGVAAPAPVNVSSVSSAHATSTASSARPRRIQRAKGAPVASVTMDLERFCAASRVVIVAGKGGVGKTTVTAALATAAARTGMSVLIVEVEGKSGLASCFRGPPLAYDEVTVRAGLRARTLTPDHALVEYLEDHGLRRI